MNYLNPLLSKTKKGFTLFIALIVSSILLTIGFSIGNIILKQLKLVNSGKESQLAFYAADSGAECALYWDRKDTSGSSVYDMNFGTSTPRESVRIDCGSTNPTPPTTNGKVYVESKNISGDIATTTFYVDFTENAGYPACSKVVVVRTGENTLVDARGYNAIFRDGVGCDITNPRTVERGLQLRY